MTITISDPAVLEALRNLDGETVEVNDASGQYVALLTRANPYTRPPGFVSKLTEEDVRYDPSKGEETYTLEEVWAYIHGLEAGK